VYYNRAKNASASALSNLYLYILKLMNKSINNLKIKTIMTSYPSDIDRLTFPPKGGTSAFKMAETFFVLRGTFLTTQDLARKPL
jgi:hypothetical protein